MTNKFLFVVVLVFGGLGLTETALALDGRARTYYGDEFDRLVRQNSSPNRAGRPGDQDLQVEQDQLVKLLKKVLRNYHEPQEGGFDRIVDRCSQSNCFKHHAVGYNSARKILLGDMYLKETPSGYAVSEVYCEKDYVAADFPNGEGPGPDKIPANAVVNIEHTWPQSRFNSNMPKDEQKSDLHHLYPSDSQMNSTRGNFEFGEVDEDIKDLKCHTARFGRVNGATGSPIFEPPTSHKGRVARALFYFSIKYDLPISRQEEAFLRTWNHDYPVTPEEQERNDRVFELQGSRNPFVDHPEIISKIQDF